MLPSESTLSQIWALVEDYLKSKTDSPLPVFNGSHLEQLSCLKSGAVLHSTPYSASFSPVLRPDLDQQQQFTSSRTTVMLAMTFLSLYFSCQSGQKTQQVNQQSICCSTSCGFLCFCCLFSFTSHPWSGTNTISSLASATLSAL